MERVRGAAPYLLQGEKGFTLRHAHAELHKEIEGLVYYYNNLDFSKTNILLYYIILYYIILYHYIILYYIVHCCISSFVSI